MMIQSDLPQTIPLFPLPGALLLPRARLPLQIFEPRYLAMLDDVLKTPHRLIGMIQTRGAEDKLCDIGCAGRLTAFTETEDGRYMITLTGVTRFRLGTLQEGFTPYLQADVSWQEFERDQGQSEADEAFNRAGFLAMLGRYFMTRGIETDWAGLKGADTELLINSLSMLCPLENEEKQALLEAKDLSARRKALETLLGFALLQSDDEVMQ